MHAANNQGDFEYRTKEALEEMIRESARNPYDDIWLNETSAEYPCLAILVNGSYACVHYFLNDCGAAWQSAGSCGQDIAFSVNGEAPQPMPGDCVVSLEDAIACMKSFFDTNERPACIAWREL